MKKRKCYIETSVWNQLFHRDRPDWKEITEIFLKNYKTNNIVLLFNSLNLQNGYSKPLNIITPEGLII